MKKSPQWKDMAWGHFYGLAHLLFLNVHSLFLLLTRSLSLSPFYFLEFLLFSVSLLFSLFYIVECVSFSVSLISSFFFSLFFLFFSLTQLSLCPSVFFCSLSLSLS